jgi:hypothetical protein
MDAPGDNRMTRRRRLQLNMTMFIHWVLPKRCPHIGLFLWEWTGSHTVKRRVMYWNHPTDGLKRLIMQKLRKGKAGPQAAILSMHDRWSSFITNTRITLQRTWEDTDYIGAAASLGQIKILRDNGFTWNFVLYAFVWCAFGFTCIPKHKTIDLCMYIQGKTELKRC